MTWEELQKRIRHLTPQQLQQQVRVVEPYDKGRSGYEVRLILAQEDIYVDEDDGEGVCLLRMGDPFLGC